MADTRVNTHQVPPVGPEEDQVPPGGLEPIFWVFFKTTTKSRDLYYSDKWPIVWKNKEGEKVFWWPF